MDYLTLNKAKELDRDISEIMAAKTKVSQLNEIKVVTDKRTFFLSSKNLACLRTAWLKELDEKAAALEAELFAL